MLCRFTHPKIRRQEKPPPLTGSLLPPYNTWGEVGGCFLFEEGGELLLVHRIMLGSRHCRVGNSLRRSIVIEKFMYYFSCLVYVCWLGCYCSVHMYCISLSRVVNLLFCSFSHYSFAQNCYVIFNIGREGFAHVAHHKKATVSDSLF